MSVEKLVERAEYLKKQLEHANTNVANLSNQLQQATVHMHTVNGHFNEVVYLVSESNKPTEVLPLESKIDNSKGD